MLREHPQFEYVLGPDLSAIRLRLIDLCFAEVPVTSPSTHVELDIDIGADAKDWSAIQAGEKLKPTELELRRIEETIGEVVKEMDYLREREHKLRDTNESTNERVKWFAIGTMFMLMVLGAWQVVYLRAYFRFVVAQHHQPVYVNADRPADQNILSSLGHKPEILSIIHLFQCTSSVPLQHRS